MLGIKKTRGVKAAAGAVAAGAAFALSAAFAAPAVADDPEYYDLKLDTATVIEGNQYTTTVTISNIGDVAAPDVEFLGVTKNADIDAQGQGWQCDPIPGGSVPFGGDAGVSCKDGDIEPGESKKITVVQDVDNGANKIKSFFLAYSPAQGEDGPFEKDRDNNYDYFRDRIEDKPAVSGTVWNDKNMDGLQDEGEEGIKDVKFAIFKGETQVYTGKTDANGDYAVDLLGAGSYTVWIDSPTPYKRSAQDVGDDDTIDSDVNVETGFSQTFECGRRIQLPIIGDAIEKGVQVDGLQNQTVEVLTGDQGRHKIKCAEDIDAGLYMEDDAPGEGGDEGELPVTGSAAATVALGGAAVLAAGGALAFAARRRRANEVA